MATMAAPTTGIRELTLRGIILGALLTVLFTAANVYLGLKIGITFATSIPAAVMTVTFLFFMLLTNHILQPTIVGKAVELSAPVTMLAAITGFTIGGVVGALFAVPTVGAIKAVLAYMRDPDHELPARPEHHSRFTLERFRRWVQRRRGRADPLPTPS